MNYGLNISHGPPSSGGGSYAGVAGGIVAGLATLAGQSSNGGTQYTSEGERLDDYQDYVRRHRAEQARRNADDSPEKKAFHRALAKKQEKQKNQTEKCQLLWDSLVPRVARARNLYHNYVVNDLSSITYRRVQNDLKDVFAENPNLRHVIYDKPFSKDDFIFCRNGIPEPNARISCRDLNVRDGGQWWFYKTHDNTRDEKYREAYAEFFKQSAHQYLMDEDLASLLVAEQYIFAHPIMYSRTIYDEGVCQLRRELSRESKTWGVNLIGHEGLVRRNGCLPTPMSSVARFATNFNVAHTIDHAAQLMDSDFSAVPSSPDDLVSKAKKLFLSSRYTALKTFTEQLSQKVMRTPAEAMARYTEKIRIKLSQMNDQVQFSMEQERLAREACSREEAHNLRECRDQIAEAQSELNGDAVINSMALSLVGGANPAAAVVQGVNWASKSIRLRHKNQICKDAYKDYIKNACIRRVLPDGMVRVNLYPENRNDPDQRPQP